VSITRGSQVQSLPQAPANNCATYLKRKRAPLIRAKVATSSVPVATIESNSKCPGGEIGKRTASRGRRPKGPAGSRPASGTNDHARMTATGRPPGLKTRGRPTRAMRVRGTLRAPSLIDQLKGIGIPRCLKFSGFPVRIRGWAPSTRVLRARGTNDPEPCPLRRCRRVGSTEGVRPGLISLGKRPDGLRRQGSSPWPTTKISPSWTNRQSRRVQTAEPRTAYCQFESGRGDQAPSVARKDRHPPSKRDFMRIRPPPDGPPFRDCLGVVVAKRPKAPRCDRGNHGFKSHRPPPNSLDAPQA
jgi:hypothetical protein